MAKAIFCIVNKEFQAENIVDQLKIAGFSANDISVLFPDKRGSHDFAVEHHTKAPEGAATGGVGLPASARSPFPASGRSSRPAPCSRHSAARRRVRRSAVWPGR
jgi:hypothetical protein